jgi:filamentous hemagglutinin
MLLSSWLKRISDRIRSRRYHPDRKPKKPDRFTQLGLTRLEDRVVLTVSAVFDAGVLDLTLDAQDDVATITVNGGNIEINGGAVAIKDTLDMPIAVAESALNRVQAFGSADTGQGVTFDSSLTLSGGTAIDGAIETTTVKAAISGVTSNEIDIDSGTLNLSADLTTVERDILLSGSVTIGDGADLTLSTGVGAGAIQIDGAVDGEVGVMDETLNLIAGTGDVTLNAVGTVTADGLESLTVTSAATTTINGAVDLDSSLTITAGTASLNDDVTSGNLQITTTANTTITGAVNSSGTIELDAATLTQNGTITAQDSVTIDVTNPLVLNQNLTSGGATTITVTADDNGALPFTLSSGVTLSSTSGMLTIQADDMNLSGTVAAAGQIVLLRQNSDGEAIELGGTGGTNNELELAVAEIDSVTASILRIGHIAAGNINFTQEVSPANSATLSLLSGGSIADIGAGGIGATNLAIQSSGTVTLDNVRNVESLAASVTGAGSSFVFGNEDDGFVIGSNVDGLTGIITADNTAGSTGSITLTTTTGSIEIAQTLMTGNASGADCQQRFDLHLREWRWDDLWNRICANRLRHGH